MARLRFEDIHRPHLHEYLPRSTIQICLLGRDRLHTCRNIGSRMHWDPQLSTCVVLLGQGHTRFVYECLGCQLSRPRDGHSPRHCHRFASDSAGSEAANEETQKDICGVDVRPRLSVGRF